MWSQMDPGALELVLTLVPPTGWDTGGFPSLEAGLQSVWHVFTPYALTGVLTNRMAPSAGYISYVPNRKINAVNCMYYIYYIIFI